MKTQQHSTKLSRWVGQSIWRLLLLQFLFALLITIPLNLLINWNATSQRSRLFILPICIGVIISLTGVFVKKQTDKEQTNSK